MGTVSALSVSNVFMTFAFVEYCFQVPANRIGYGQFTAAQMKIIQEVITLLVFVVFSILYLKEEFHWNYSAAFLCIPGVVSFAFRTS